MKGIFRLILAIFLAKFFCELFFVFFVKLVKFPKIAFLSEIWKDVQNKSCREFNS